MDLLQVIIINAQKVHFKALSSCSRVSKDMRDIVYKSWHDKVMPFETPVYHPDSSGKCHMCHKSPPATDFKTCSKCTNDITELITATEVKKEWYLKENDLELLNVVEKYIKKYRTDMRLFSSTEVRHCALIKYGPKKLWEKKNRRNQPSKAFENRVKMLEKENLDLDKNTMKRKLCVDDFLKNGKGGIRGVKQKIAAYDQFDRYAVVMKAADIFSNSALYEYKRKFIESEENERSYIINSMERDIDRKNASKGRENTLKTRLNAVGLPLRSDSKMCAEYIRGERNDLEKVVETMQEMSYLFQHTNYQSILSGIIESWRRDIRASYGWMDREDFNYLFQDELPTLSERAKRVAVSNKKNVDLPSYMLKYKHR